MQRIFEISWSNVYFTLFHSLVVSAIYFIGAHDFSIRNFDGQIISQAVMENVEVGLRTGLYYKTLGIFLCTFLLILALINRIKWKIPDFHGCLKMLNSVSFGGIILLLCSVFIPSQWGGVTFLLLINAGILLFWMIAYLLDHKEVFKPLNIGFLFSLSISLVCLFGSSSLQVGEGQSFLKLFALMTTILIILLVGLSKFAHPVKKVMWMGLPLLCIPLLSTLANEGYLILNHRSINGISPLFLYLLFLVLLGIWMIIRYRKSVHNPMNSEPAFKRLFFPVLLIGLFLNGWYEPFVEPYDDFFELANPANAQLRIFTFGEWPFVHFLSSHLISEQFYGFVYFALHGFDQSLGFLSYGFQKFLIHFILGYWLIYRISGNVFFAAFCVLLFPLFNDLADKNYIPALLSLYWIIRIYGQYRQRDVIYLLLWTAFLCFWQMDTGYANLICVMTLLGLFHFTFDRSGYWRNTIKSLGFVFGGLILLFLGVHWISDADLLLQVRKALGYLTATEAHGYAHLYNQPSRLFLLHYIIFPCALVLAGVVLVSKIRKFLSVNTFRFPILLMVFAIVFTLANAERGLVRHIWVHAGDGFISGFVFLIAATLAWYLLKRSSLHQHANEAFLSVGAVSILLLGIGSVKNQESHFQKFKYTFAKGTRIQPANEKIDQVIGMEAFASEHFSQLKEFMDENMEPHQTFLDFSNSPMLYYYLGRKVPSYFNQYLQNTVTIDLQQKNIEHLKQFDIPFVIYSHIPERWGDKTDNVPNALRYPIIANHIYHQYKPLVLIDGYYIWQSTGLDIDIGPAMIVDSAFIFRTHKYQLKFLPQVLSKFQEVYQWEDVFEVNHDGNSGSFIDLDFNYSVQQYLYLEFTNEIQYEEFYCNFIDERLNTLVSILMKPTPGIERTKYLIPVSWMYPWSQKKIHAFEVASEYGDMPDIRKTEIRSWKNTK